MRILLIGLPSTMKCGAVQITRVRHYVPTQGPGPGYFCAAVVAHLQGAGRTDKGNRMRRVYVEHWHKQGIRCTRCLCRGNAE